MAEGRVGTSSEGLAERRALALLRDPNGFVSAALGSLRRITTTLTQALRFGTSLADCGAVAVEFAIVAPVLLAMLTGTAQFGLTLNQFVILTNAVATGAQLFSISRGTMPTPYTSTVAAIEAAAPNLIPANLTITLSVNGTACTTDAACQTALSNAATDPATVTATYPCSLEIAFYNFWPGCTLQSQVTEPIQ
jgi:Flp pilus assembly protein TadG